MALTQSVLLQLQRELSVQRRLKSNLQPQLRPSKSPESLSSDWNFQDFENLESLNRNQSSFAKRQLQDYWCNLLNKFHTSNQDI